MKEIIFEIKNILSEFKVTKEDSGLLPIYAVFGLIYLFSTFFIIFGDQCLREKTVHDIIIFSVFLLAIFGSYLFSAIIYALLPKSFKKKAEDSI